MGKNISEAPPISSSEPPILPKCAYVTKDKGEDELFCGGACTHTESRFLSQWIVKYVSHSFTRVTKLLGPNGDETLKKGYEEKKLILPNLATHDPIDGWELARCSAKNDPDAQAKCSGYEKSE